MIVSDTLTDGEGFGAAIDVDGEAFAAHATDDVERAKRAARNGCFLQRAVRNSVALHQMVVEHSKRGSHGLHRARVATALDWMLSSDRQTIAQAQYEMLSTDLRPQLAQISAPVLAIAVWRGREAFGFTREKVLQQMTEQYRAVPHYDVVVSDTARHFVMLDEPEWLASQISGFIQR
ncbi:MAG: alpha/beta hydrolase [Acidobacteria bacterium]|nr:alpha/beta hydrolase [Acidobacteriota bacterium]